MGKGSKNRPTPSPVFGKGKRGAERFPHVYESMMRHTRDRAQVMEPVVQEVEVTQPEVSGASSSSASARDIENLEIRKLELEMKREELELRKEANRLGRPY